ncbi:hypothetical protein ABE042_12215 [Viridibacillus arvi]|uniref:hypothetical protein n=1 Tax=Viridibacillus arvi TaxID=263475 RepID=UPI003D2D47B6
MDQLLYYLSKAKNPLDVLEAWNFKDSTFNNTSAIVCLENYKNNFFSEEFIKTVYFEDNDFISYFQSEKLYFINDEIIKSIFFTGNVDIPIDYSIMFDSNYASYISFFVNNDMSRLNNEAFTTISLLLNENFQYDYRFYLLENSKNIDLNKEFDIDYFKKVHNDIFRNITNLELFKSIDSKLFKDKILLKYTITTEEAENNAEELINDIYCSELGRTYLKEMSFMRKEMTLFLIGVFKIHFSSKKDAKKKIVELFDYMDKKVGIYFEREALVAYKYFKQQSEIKIFSKLQRNMNTSNLLSIINNISWDFTAPRFMEYFMRYEKEGKFFIPFLLTHDLGLKEVIKLFNVKGVISDESYGFIPISSINTKEYYENKNCKINFEVYFSKEKQKDREIRMNKNREEIDTIITEECNELITILNSH